MKRVCAVILGLTFGSYALSAEPAIDFTREIQPIFAKRCYKCHGPNAKKGGLQLSTNKGAQAKLESGNRAIVPGKLSASAIMARIQSKDESDRMPPEGKPLSPAEIARIKRWIQTGAKWSDHWSFRKIRRPQVPAVKKQAWVRNPIDAFILNRLERAGLQPAKSANKVALIRRAYYDLTGLPPSPDDVDAFVADKSPRAFEKVIDKLLKSPQYGEKWARHWLDLVRYAETNGYERDTRKNLIWKYRDYVIRAFNADKPYDRFIVEQLAGDEIPHKNGDSITATGFYRLGVWDDDPADRVLARYDYLDDILRTTSETFLAMTIGCARCHDHKIDPVAQKDYYSLLAFFSDISPHGSGNRNHVKISNAMDKEKFAKQVAAKKARERTLADQVLAIERSFRTKLAKKYPQLKLKPARPAGPKDAVVLADSRKQGQQWEYTTKRPADDWYKIAFDDKNWKKGLGGFGTKGTPGSIVRTVWNSRDIWLRKDFRLTEIPARLFLTIHHDEDAEVYLNGKRIAARKSYIKKYLRLDVTMAAGDVLQTGRNTLAIHCRQTGGGQYIDAGLYGDFSFTTTAGLARKYGVEILGKDTLTKWIQLQRELSRSQAQKLTLRTEFVMAVAERGRNKTYILGRGSPANREAEVGPAFPQILDPPQAVVPKSYTTGSTTGKRRRLAEWIVSKDNPVTARVIVNRIWQHHFGQGIVRTTSDFGFQGSPPSHPQLLDWLASEFVKRGWKMKTFHKLIMLSATYQMSAQKNAQALSKDPTNRLLWRFNMRRLTAEEIRDSILAVTGTLNKKMFGSAIFPPLPREVLATSSTPNRAWGRSSPEESARRSIYIHVKRSLRPPMLVDFDSPDADSACSVRVSTTVPTQALGMLNSQFMKEMAAQLASRLQKERKQLAAQVELAIRLTTGRKPAKKEVNSDVQFMNELIREQKLTTTKALQSYALLILNTNEFVYLD